MKHFTIALVLAAGIGMVWAAEKPSEKRADTEVPESMEAMTEEEVQAELQRIEDALGETDELKEFLPTKPLAADLPIDLPSDM
jgi:hypothetical protein